MTNCKECGKEIPMDHAQVGGVHMTCEWEYFYNNKVQMMKLKPVGNYPYCIVTPKEGNQIIQESEDPMESEIVWMSKGKIESLEEFEGW